jgi:N-acetyl-anhydromuramyl-L-alanine amidase AmpD
MPGFRVPSPLLQGDMQMDRNRGYAALAVMNPAGGMQPTPVSTAPQLLPSGALTIDTDGIVQDAKVTQAIHGTIEHGPMPSVNGIIVHQTGGASAQSALNSYKKPGAHGAHFLIDKDGTVYQTASVFKVTHHVGNLKSRCMAEMRCLPAELAALKGKGLGAGIGRVEAKKPWPDRYPGNSDSIGIEIVGQALPLTEKDEDKRTYEALTDEQQRSFTWLLDGLRASLGVSLTEVFTHPTVSWKNKTEGMPAKW